MGLTLPKQEPAVFARPRGNERERLVRMRTALVMGSPFYGLLAYRMKLTEMTLVQCEAIGTAATDGKHFFYNPSYIAGMSDTKVRGLWGHETMHNANRHPWRRGNRHHRLWNIACDYAIDGILVKAGFDVPNALVYAPFTGKAPEEIYAILWEDLMEELRKRQQQRERSQQEPDEDEDDDSEDGDSDAGAGDDDAGDGDPQDGADDPQDGADEAGSGDGTSGQDRDDSTPGTGAPQGGQPKGNGSNGNGLHSLLDELYGAGPTKGEVLDAPTETAMQDQVEWTQAVVSAAEVARLKQGTLPDDLEAMIAQATAPRIDWKAVTRRFMQTHARLDYSWMRPSPRYAGQGHYLPALRSERLGPIVVVGDTSYSTKTYQEQFFGELDSIIEEANPELVHFLQVDARVQKHEELYPGDPIKMDVKGYGGTDFRPAFAWVEEQGVEPVCMVYLTDCEGTYPEVEPPYPVLWVCTQNPEHLSEHYYPPFGEVLYLDLED